MEYYTVMVKWQWAILGFGCYRNMFAITFRVMRERVSFFGIKCIIGVKAE